MERTKDFECYIKYLKDRELAVRTREIYVKEAGRFRSYCSDNGIAEKNLTKSDMIAYKTYLMKCGYAPATLNLYIVAVNCYLNFLGLSDYAVKTIRVQEKQSLEKMLSLEEYQALLNYARQSGKEKYYMILKTLAMTGIRISELKFFTVESLAQNTILVMNKRKTREICFPENLVSELRTYCRNFGITGGVIFRGSKDAPISRIAVYKMLVKMADAAGVEKGKVHPHNFRHLFAVTYMEHYANLFELADLLGHSSLETTRIYARSTVQEKRKRINELGL